MPIAPVGSAPTVSVGTAGAAVTPAYGTGANRSLNNLLLLLVSSGGSATFPAAITNWPIWLQQAGTSCSASLYYKIATGADAAPTVPVVASAVHNAVLFEFSGAAAISPGDQKIGGSGTASPVVATAPAVDATARELLVAVGGAFHATSRTNPALKHTLNNGVGAGTSTDNDSTTAASHYAFVYGITTSNAAADSDSMAVTTTQLTGAVLLLASFKALPVLPSELFRHRSPVSAVHGQLSRGRF